MSSLRGLPGERWTLAHAVDAMADAVRQVRRPALVWLVGHVYPGMSLLAGSGSVWTIAIAGSPGEIDDERVGVAFGFGVLSAIFLSRFIAGAAALGAPEAWARARGSRRSARIRDVWRAGKGLHWSALGLWVQTLVMLALVSLVCLGPPLYVLEHTLGIDPRSSSEEQVVMAAVVLGPFVGLVLAFAFVLTVVYQLALQSLVHNRRGVTSALVHGWRIARAEPWATTRAVVVDFLLTVTVTLLWIAMSILLVATCIGSVLFWAPPLLMTGFAGLARAAYWARVYRELGGLSPEDQVPGLSGEPTAEPAR